MRDIKAFRNARGYRTIPISYSSSDGRPICLTSAEYFACGNDDTQGEEESFDLFGIQAQLSGEYATDYTQSGYGDMYEDFKNYSLPVVFSGIIGNICMDTSNLSRVATVLGPVLQAVFSGAIVQGWYEMWANFSLVEYPNKEQTGFSSTLDGYNSLVTIFSSADLAGTSMASYTPSNSAPACPTPDNSGWPVDPKAALPTIPGLDVGTATARTTFPGGTGGGKNSGSTSTTELETGEDGGGLGVAGIAGLAFMGGILALAALGAICLSADGWQRRRIKLRARSYL